MNAPDWLLGLCEKRLSLAAMRVGLVLCRLGHQKADPSGNPIIYNQVPVSRLQRLTALSHQSVLNGLTELEALAGLVRHPAIKARAPSAYTLPLVYFLDYTTLLDHMEAGTGLKSRPPGGGGGGVPSNRSSLEDKGTPPPPPGGLKASLLSVGEVEAALARDLEDLGASVPQDFFDRFPLEEIQGWVDWARGQKEGVLKNPAGFIRRQLEGRRHPPAARDKQGRGADPRDFTRGKYGRLIKY